MARDHRHVLVLEDDDVAGVSEQRGNIGGEIRLSLSQAHHDAARAVLGRDQAIRRALGQHHDSVRALQLPQRPPYRLLQSRRVLEMPLDEMRDDLGVRLGREDVPLGGQALLDGEVVLDDAVVDHDERARAVRMRMRVLVGRPSMGRPAGMADADASPHGPLAEDALQYLDATCRAPDLESARPQHGHAGRVVAAILELLEPVDDDSHRVFVPQVTDDSAHGVSAPSSRRRAEPDGRRPSLPS